MRRTNCVRGTCLFFIAGLCVSFLAGCGNADRSGLIPPEGKYDVRILRDNWGVAHVFDKKYAA